MNRENITKLLKGFFLKAKSVFTRNVGLKIISILLAVFLWSTVTAANPNITRDKTLYSLPVYVTGQSLLSSRNLAIVYNDEDDQPVTAKVNVPQSSFSLVNSSNVRIEMDLTGIKTTGTQRVKLAGSSVYGDVVQIWPEYIDVDVEALDSRYVPINVSLTNVNSQDFWYSTRMNPAQVTVSGPTSIVQNVSSAEISVDVSDMTSSQTRAEKFVLKDSRGNEITADLTKSTSSVMVYLDIYPAKTVSIPSDITDVVSGNVAPGYEISSVTVSPETVLIAGEQSLLDGISSIGFPKIDVSGRSVSFSRTVSLNTAGGLKYISSNQANVTVTINEIETTRKFDGIPVVFLGGEGDHEAEISVVVSGKYTMIEPLTEADIIATVDLTGLTEGEYDLPVIVNIHNSNDITCTASPSVVTVNIGA